MATPDGSPSLFAGQMWSDWASSVPLSPIEDSSGDNTKDKELDVTDSMKLPQEDMTLFGQCPSQDEFYLVKCELCSKVVKPQAFKTHLEERHGSEAVEAILHSTVHESKLSSPASKLSSPNRGFLHQGHSVPTKASVKEVPLYVSNAQKLGASVSASLKSKSRKNHSMPVVKVERMDVSRVSQHYEPVTKSHSISNGNISRDIHHQNTVPPTSESLPVSLKSSLKSSAQEGANSPHKLSSPKEATQGIDNLTLETNHISITPTTPMTITTTSVSTSMSFSATTTVAVVHSSSKSSISAKDSSPKVTTSSTGTSNWTNIGSVGSLGSSGRPSFGGFKLGNLGSTSVHKSHSASSGFHHRPKNSASMSQLNSNTTSLSNKPSKSPSMSSLMENLMANTSRAEKSQSSNSANNTTSQDSSLGERSHSSDSSSSLASHSGTSLNSGISSLNSSDDSLKSPTGVERQISFSDTSLNSSSSSLNLSGSHKKSPKISKPDKLIPCKDREYDCNKHCGVLVEETGKPCTRSLTCKTHALSLRRKVQGRKKSFDDLLKEHRAAKEVLLKQKAEQKAAQIAAAEQRMQHKSGSHLLSASTGQSGVVRANSSQSLAEHLKDAAQPRIPGSTLPKKSFKPAQKLHSGLTHRSSLTNLYSPLSAPLKDDPGGGPSQDPTGRLSEGEEEEEGWAEKAESTHLTYHPKPAALCTFGARMHMLGNRRCMMFGRRNDFVRNAFMNVLDRHMNPPPPKKLCVESNLPKDPFSSTSKDPYDFTSLESGHTAKHFKPVLNSNHKPNVKPKSKPSSSSGRTKSKDGQPGSKSPAQTTASNTVGGINSNPTLTTPQGVKRKRNSAGGLGSSPNTYTPAIQQQTFNVISSISVTNVNSHNNNNALTAIAIPSVNLNTTALGQLGANLTQSKSQKNTMYKDPCFVVNLDSSTLNGQYINITNSAANAQRIDNKTFQQTHVIASTDKNNPKILNLDKFPALQKNNVIAMPPFIVEGLQSGTAVLAPVSLATTLNNPIVAMTTNTSVSPSQPSPNTYRSGSCSPQVSSPVPNGVVNSNEKLITSARHGVPNAKKSAMHNPVPHSLIGSTVMVSSNSSQVCPSQIFTTQLAQLQVKPTNFTMAKGVPSNKVTMQPLSLTFPLTNLSGVPGQPTFYIASSEDSKIPKQMNSSPSGHVS
ncbi:hypothetical protein FSP39_013080 [Pinctada imbricata]|uniref:SCA7 domain-containing protein n=1 Tax=Pinctada imbricata TaxID=66713 RepID=A0AA89CAP2_PINIB|nr:hypothetical protein FSP39_013080 [Pinctada imbricata]